MLLHILHIHHPLPLSPPPLSPSSSQMQRPANPMRRSHHQSTPRYDPNHVLPCLRLIQSSCLCIFKSSALCIFFPLIVTAKEFLPSFSGQKSLQYSHVCRFLLLNYTHNTIFVILSFSIIFLNCCIHSYHVYSIVLLTGKKINALNTTLAQDRFYKRFRRFSMPIWSSHSIFFQIKLTDVLSVVSVFCSGPFPFCFCMIPRKIATNRII